MAHSSPSLQPAVRARGILTLAISLVLATIVMFSLGYRATREWEQSSLLAFETRGKEVLALIAVALERDMKGGQVVVLFPFNQSILDSTPLYDIADRFLSGFARFPYIESFFVWKNTGDPAGLTHFFNRADRPPSWDSTDESGDPYPVIIRRDPAPAQVLVTAARNRAARGARFAVFESTLSGVRHQTLVHFLYGGSSGHLYGLVGFTVNLDWVRGHYFSSVIEQIQQIGGDYNTSIEIVDDRDQVVARTGPSAGGPAQSRTFPILFADRALVSHAGVTARDPQLPEWTARVHVATDPAVGTVRRGVGRTIALLALAGLVTIIAVAFTVRAASAAAKLVMLQSEFMSSVTHEMKTPLALIRLAGDTLANGRYSSPTTVRDYGELLTTEADRLTRLIDNVLSYARISDPKRAYSFEPVDIPDVIEDALDRFRPQLSALDFDIQFDPPVALPHVRADRGMMLHVIGNLIDNVVKHGNAGRALIIRVHANARWVHIEVSDRGDGIPPDEVARVFEKFYRGRSARQHGTGLGLAIARRIVEEHGGAIGIRSVVGQGTSVDLALPVVTDDADPV